MAFAVEPTEAVSRSVQRAIRRRLRRAIARLDGLERAEAAETARAIHYVRKRTKEVRAAARLIGPAVGDPVDEFNAGVRDAAALLAPVRDAYALLATFDDLRAACDLVDDLDLGLVRVGLVEEAGLAAEGMGPDDPRIAGARDLLRESRSKAKRWDVPDGFDILAPGLTATYRHGRKGLRRARKKPTDQRLHDWRKSVKDLWYQTRLLERAAPSVLSPYVLALDDVAKALGDDHDLTALVAHLHSDPERFGGDERVAVATELAVAQQVDLQRRAFRLGATIFAEHPDAFTVRIGHYWTQAIEQGPELAAGSIAALTAAAAPAPTPDLAAVEAEPDPEPEDRAEVEERSGPSVERERKFLVTAPPPLPEAGITIRQGYLAIDGAVSVRLRDAAEQGRTITIKAGRGSTRTELEWAISEESFAAAWDQTRDRRIRKTRHRMPLDDDVVDVDVFLDDHAGLIVAEVEFDSDDAMAAFEPPDWFGREVTDDDAFTNAALAARRSPNPPESVRHRWNRNGTRNRTEH